MRAELANLDDWRLRGTPFKPRRCQLVLVLLYSHNRESQGSARKSQTGNR